ncbi:MAG: hypothetical protein ACOC58_03380 [Chloroflexota bacterium]
MRARFVTTSSGIVHQFQYEPEGKHGVFKPVAELPNEPDEGGWFLWEARNYTPCDANAEYKITDFLSPDTYWWVQLEDQE